MTFYIKKTEIILLSVYMFVIFLPWNMRGWRCGCSHFGFAVAEREGPVTHRRKAQAVGDGLIETKHLKTFLIVRFRHPECNNNSNGIDIFYLF